ncbi:MAG: phosphate ABC transporter permease subunit PstC [Planctomycetota bacterium]
MNYNLQSSNLKASNIPGNASAKEGVKRFGDKRISDILVESRKTNVRRQRIQEFIIEKLLFVGGLAAIVFIALIFIFLFKEGIKAFFLIKPLEFIGTHILDFDDNRVFACMWQPVGESGKYSIIPLIIGSFLVALPATLISTILGVGCGIYLAEIATAKIRAGVKPAIELLAGIPTVVIGFLCLTILATYVQNAFHTTFRLNAFVGAIGVSMVIIPVIASITDDALRAVPGELREASYGLGATKWETIWKVVVPAGISGITASIILGMGRALGETMIVVMATGNAALVTGNVFSSVRTMTATIAAELGAVPQGGSQYCALFLVGSILFFITFVLNLVAEMIISRMRKKLRL